MTRKSTTSHRQKLREQFLSGDTKSYSDEKLLELLLTFAISRKDVKSLAKELVCFFGGVDEVLAASFDDLIKFKGLGKASITLLKAVDFIKSKTTPHANDRLQSIAKDNKQLQLFQDSQSASSPTRPPKSAVIGHLEPSTTQTASSEESTIALASASEHALADHDAKDQKSVSTPGKKSTVKKSARRKLQVSNSYLLEFDQLARVLSFLLEQKESKRIKRAVLTVNTGLADRQVEGLVSMGTAMGIIKPNVQILTPFGLILATHDIFLENSATLEWCHYKAAGSYQNLIWFQIFNHLLPEESAMTQDGWQEYFRNQLRGQYTAKTLKTHVHKEIRFVVDAYTERNFSKLELLKRSADGLLYRKRYSTFNPLILSGMIYDFCDANETRLFQVEEMVNTPGSPAVVFGLDGASFRQHLEGLHNRGWLRYETTHNLDQIRLKACYSAVEFLTAFYESREPSEAAKQSPGGIFK